MFTQMVSDMLNDFLDQLTTVLQHFEFIALP